MDVEFNKVIPKIPQVTFNTSAAILGLYGSNTLQKDTRYHDNQFGTLLCF